MNDQQFVTDLLSALDAEATCTIDLCLRLKGEDRRRLTILTAVFFLEEYYGWGESRIVAALPQHARTLVRNVAHVRRAAVEVKGEIFGGRYEKFCRNLLAKADGAYYVDEMGMWWRHPVS